MSKPGIYIALTPDYGFDKSLVGLDIHLINALGTGIAYYYDFEAGEVQESFEGELPSLDSMRMGHLYFAQLNENPTIMVECTFDQNGKLQKVEKTIRLKPKVIHNGPKFSPLLNEEAFVYDVYLQKELPATPPKPPTPKRKLDIDPDMLKHLMMDNATPKYGYDISNAEYELDLHFHTLVKDESSYNNAEKLHVQLETFQRKLDSAIANGLHSMVVIHGVGSGRLKEEVGKILKQHPKVKSFGPCMHRKYGFGATEVFF